MSFNIDHVVITVSDINKSIDFYSNILGMELQEFSSSTDNVKRKSLKFGIQKINLHEASKPFKPHANNPIPGAMDICFLSEINIVDWIKIFNKFNIKIEDGPVKKTGANAVVGRGIKNISFVSILNKSNAI